MIVYPRSVVENDGLKAWIEQRLPEYRSGSSTICVGVERAGKLVAVIAWDGYREGTSVDVSIAADSPRWASRQTITSLLMYPFGQLGVRRINSYVYKSNKRSRKFNEGIGFKLEGKLRDCGNNNEPLLLFGMTRRDFIKKYVEPYVSTKTGERGTAENHQTRVSRTAWSGSDRGARPTA
jgi:RimJ/RimL family protein N-acetyltransferase